MARALSHDARLIVMDEPSAVLDPDEVANLFRVIRELTAHGIAVVYISHRLEEIRQIGDRITVLKDGRTVAQNLPAAGTPTRELIKLMTGRSVEYVFPPGSRSPRMRRRCSRSTGLGFRSTFDDVSFDVRAGEIVGLAGLVGSGRSEMLETVYGARKPTSGTVRVGGRELRPGSVAAAVEPGSACARRNARARASCSTSRSTATSRCRPSPGSPGTACSPNGVSERPPRAGALARSSGRAGSNVRSAPCPAATSRRSCSPAGCCTACRVLLLDEPTRGVDVGARAEIYGLIRRLADEGVAVVIVSSEMPEVLGLADRVLVIREGRVVHEGPADRDRRARRARPGDGRKRRVSLQKESGAAGSATPGAGGSGEVGKGPTTSSRLSNLLSGSVGRNLGLVIALLLLCVVGVDHRGRAVRQRRQPAHHPAPGRRHRRGHRRHDLRDHRRRHRPVGRRDDGAGQRSGPRRSPRRRSPRMSTGSSWSAPRSPSASAAGLINGVLIAYGKVVAVHRHAGDDGRRPRSGAEIISQRQTQIVTVETFHRTSFRGDVLGIPLLVSIFAVVAVVGWVLLNRTTFGRRTVAVGGNPRGGPAGRHQRQAAHHVPVRARPGCAAGSPP